MASVSAPVPIQVSASAPVLPVIAWLASQDEDMDVKERMEELTLDQEDASERVAKAR